MVFKVPEKQRLLDGAFASTWKEGNNGAFLIRLKAGGRAFTVIASDGAGWEHVSVSLPDRCPTWDEMCKIKNKFWCADDAVMQYHPPASEYVNNHPHCLHLWRKCGENPELPPSILVGIK